MSNEKSPSQSGIIHCPGYLVKHPLYADFGSDLETLSEADYPGRGYFRDTAIPAIDVDGYERATAKIRDCTSDAVIGIADFNESAVSHSRMLITELRMDYESERNLQFHKISRKYSHSSEVLRKSAPWVVIEPRFAMIFRRSVAPMAKNRFNRWSKEGDKREAKKWDAFWVESFCNHINLGYQIPVKPSVEAVKLLKQWTAESNLGYDEFERLNKEIQARWYEMKMQRRDVDLDYLREKLTDFLTTLPIPSDPDERDLLALAVEELRSVLGC